MKHAIKGLFSIALLTCMAADLSALTTGRSFYLGHVGDATSNGLIEQADRNHRDSDELYGTFSVHMEYNGSTKAGGIGQYFNWSGLDTMKIGPQKTTTANLTTDIFSPMLLLGNAFVSTIKLAPKITTFSTDLRLFVGLNEFMEGLWFDANLPIVHTKWNANLTESGITASTAITANYFEDSAGVAEVAPYANAVEALKGDKTLADVSTKMAFATLKGSQSMTKVGNAKVTLGYDFVNKEDCYLGAGIMALINGGGKSDAVYVFEPSVGTGGRHGVGGRIDGHVRVYEKDDNEITLNMRADVVHLFDSTVKRTFDYTTNGAGSRYIPQKEFTAAATPLYNNIIAPGPNVSTLDAKVGMGAMYNVDLMFRWTNGSLGVDVGYGLWGHSAEKHKKWVTEIASNKYGFWSPDADGTVGEGTANRDGNATNLGRGAGTDTQINGLVTTAPIANTATNQGTQMVATEDLNKDSGMSPSNLSNHVYANVGYAWDDSEWEPHVNVGGGAEFGSGNKSMSQWGVHFGGGICF